jgi:hypothetical protein
MAFFRNPELIEQGAKSFKINESDFKNTTLKDPHYLFNLTAIKQYILKSRSNIEFVS